MDILPVQDSLTNSGSPLLSLLTRIVEAVELAVVHLQAIDRKLAHPGSQSAPEFLSIKEAAALASLSQTKVRREVKAGRLPASDIGTPAHPHYRIARADLQAWMEKNRGGNHVPPQPQRIKEKVRSRHFGDI